MSKLKRGLITTGIIVALILGWLIFVYFWEGSTKPILAVADKFQPGSAWILEQETIRAPRIVCESIDVECPYVGKSWRSETVNQLTYEQLNFLLNTTGWQINLERQTNCGMNTSVTFVLSCSASGNVGRFYVQFYYHAPRENQKAEMSLSVTKAH